MAHKSIAVHGSREAAAADWRELVTSAGLQEEWTEVFMSGLSDSARRPHSLVSHDRATVSLIPDESANYLIKIIPQRHVHRQTLSLMRPLLKLSQMVLD